MEAVRPYTTQVIPCISQTSELQLEEGLLEFDHITLNTTIYCVTKQQIENWTLFH